MTRYAVLLRSDEAPTPAFHEYTSDEEVYVGDAIVVDGIRVLVDDCRVGPDGPVLECRRLWKLRLVDAAAEAVARGFILNEQWHYGDADILVIEGDERFRVLRVERGPPAGYDGGFVVERLPTWDA